MKIQNVKGGYDYLPDEQRVRNYINETLKEIFEEYGYNSIETPILCYYDMLSDKYEKDSDILNEIYKLTDQGNRKLGLRYDLTVPFAKFIALNKNKIQLPFKRYEISKVFRDGPVKVGRDREFTQCDVDVVGLPGQVIEAELLTLFKRAFDKLGINIIIKYNSRLLMNGLLMECSVTKELLSSVTTIIDKKEKVDKVELINMLIECGLSEDVINKIDLYFDMSLSELNIKFKNTINIQLKKGLEEINNLSSYIEKLGLQDTCVYASYLARGQNYYTGNVFEVYDKDENITCSIAAGGRYDNMITDFINDGNEYPAVGISFGLSGIFEILKKKSNMSSSNLDIFIIPIDTKVESIKLANKIRDLGFKVLVEMKERKLKKSLDYSNKEKVPYVIILGIDEVNNKSFKLKDMVNSKEYTISLNNLKELNEIIK